MKSIKRAIIVSSLVGFCACASYVLATLPQQLKSARMTDATLGSSIDNEVGNLEKALADILGIPIDTNITNAAFTISATGTTDVNAASTGLNINVSGTQRAKVTSTGHLRLAIGNTPTMGSCGTSPSVTGTDGAGRITIGSGSPGSCTLNFSQTYSTAPFCTASAGQSLGMSTTVSTTSIIFTSTAFSEVAINYICMASS